MSKLEPTRTYSNHTATDVLRRMLDERGVEWWQSVNMIGCVFTRWYSPLFSDEVVAMENGDGELELFSHLMTPEQAIAATLGSCNCPNNCTNDERTGTCEADETDLIPFVRADSDDFKVDYIHVMECTECGHVYEHVNGDYEYCPRCGRKREDVSE